MRMLVNGMVSHENDFYLVLVHCCFQVVISYFYFLNFVQGHRKGRTKTTGLLHNLKMLFRSCIWAHINHKLGTFYYLHQHSQKLHPKIHLDTLLFFENMTDLG